jgi:hypothetical protein
MRVTAKHRLASLLTIIALVASSLVAGSPAQAYGALWIYADIVDLTDCSEAFDNLNFYPYGGGCRHDDPVDYTYFRPNQGGEGIKAEFYQGGPRGGGGQMVAKVEFHPYDELLWIYDTKNDSDTIYVRLYWWEPGGGPHGFTGALSAPGTNDTVDIRVVNLSYPEGTEIRLRVYDDSSMTELLVQIGLGRA